MNFKKGIDERVMEVHLISIKLHFVSFVLVCWLKSSACVKLTRVCGMLKLPCWDCGMLKLLYWDSRFQTWRVRCTFVSLFRAFVMQVLKNLSSPLPLHAFSHNSHLLREMLRCSHPISAPLWNDVFHLQRMNYEEHPSILASGGDKKSYVDRAAERRQTVGSEAPIDSRCVETASVHRWDDFADIDRELIVYLLHCRKKEPWWMNWAGPFLVLWL